jgi:hypothetical protein
MMKKSVVARGFFFLRVFGWIFVVKKMPLGREEDRGPIAKNALGNLPSKKRTR